MDPHKHKYSLHKSSAKQRGIEFDLTFEEWKSVWGHHIENRGREKGQLVMARTLDRGGYSVGNVRVATHSENVKEAGVVKTRRLVAESGVDQGWISRGKVFNEYIEEND